MAPSSDQIPQPTVTETSIAGLYEIDLVLNVLGDDERGTFREAWQAEKMEAAGLPPFKPVQYNVAESKYGVIRGIHAEPWEKLIHVASGTVFAAITDFRKDSKTFGNVLTFELDSHRALFVPRGVGNSYAVTSQQCAYTYLVNEHWNPDATYDAVRHDDPDLAIQWPIPEPDRIVSEKDRTSPTFKEAFGG